MDSAPRSTFLTRLRQGLNLRNALLVLPAVAILVVLRQLEVTSVEVPAVVIAAMVVGAWLAVCVADAAFADHHSMRAIWLSTCVETLSIGLIIYATGWGPTLAIGYGAGCANRLAESGSRSIRPVMVVSTISILIGQLAIALGIAPSIVPSPEVQGLGAVALVGVLLVEWMMGDQTKRREDADALARNNEEWFRALVQHASDAILVFKGEHGRISYVSPALERLIGYPVGPGTDHPALDILHPDDIAPLQGVVSGMDDADGLAWLECRVRHADGTYHTLEVGLSDLTDNPAVQGYVANVRDVTERRLFEQQLSYQAYHDSLTHLPNRSQFLERLESALTRSLGVGSQLAVVFLDVDQFKVVNDSLGHEVGDRLLIEIATRLRSCLRPGDVVARFGGDEFTVLLEDVASSADAIVVADRILDSLRVPIAVGGRELHTGASIGIAVSGIGSTEADAGELLREADLAMYLAKERGRGRWELFDAHTAPEMVERLEIESGLRRAIDDGHLVVHFQPEIALDGGSVIALEALVRWEHPARGMLYPGAFIPFAEESSLILEVDRFVLRESMRRAVEWNGHLLGRLPVRVSVNLSPRFLRQLEAVDEIETLLESTGACADWIQIEITERVTIGGDERTIQTLRALQALGISIAIDDFGTGYSSLAYLRDLPVDVLKLDQSFVAGIETQSQFAIVEAVITMGHALGVRVTAEGVEFADQLHELRNLGCDSVQGFHFSAAVPAEIASTMIAGLASARLAQLADAGVETEVAG